MNSYEYGITNENSQVKALIKKATTLQSTYESAYDETTKERLQNQIDVIEQQLEELGIPTWEEYQSNPEYRIRASAEKMEEQYGVSEYYIDRDGNKTSAAPSYASCSPRKSLSFKVGWEYKCGWFRCNYAAPSYMVLYEGQEYSQSIWYGSGHDEIFPFHLVKSSHHNTSAEYFWDYEALKNDIPYHDDADQVQRYFLLANWDHWEHYEKLINPQDTTELKTLFDVDDIT